MNTQGYIKEDLEEVLRAVSLAFAVDPEDIIGRRRQSWIINPRFCTYHLLRQKGWSLEAVAQACGGRDHGAIMHGIKTLKGRLDRFEIPVNEKALGKALVVLREEGYEL